MRLSEDMYVSSDRPMERLRAFTLKKHEITVAAKNEVEKLQDKLLFVSMQDYNIVLEENVRLRKLLQEKTIEVDFADDHTYMSKKQARIELGLSIRKIDSYTKIGLLKPIKNRQGTYYARADLEKNADVLRVKPRSKKV